MGIFKYALVVTAIAVALPSPPKAEGEQSDVVAQSVSMFSYLTAAAETFADVRGFCARKPDVCQTASHIAGTVESKAKYSAKLIYEWANEATDTQVSPTPLPHNLAKADPIATGSTRRTAIVKIESQSTLRLEDLIPEWQAPAIPKKG